MNFFDRAPSASIPTEAVYEKNNKILEDKDSETSHNLYQKL